MKEMKDKTTPLKITITTQTSNISITKSITTFIHKAIKYVLPIEKEIQSPITTKHIHSKRISSKIIQNPDDKQSKQKTHTKRYTKQHKTTPLKITITSVYQISNTQSIST